MYKLVSRNQQAYTLTKVQNNQNSAPLHWCHDDRPHSGTELYMEWISAQPPKHRLPSIDTRHPPGNPQGP